MEMHAIECTPGNLLAEEVFLEIIPTTLAMQMKIGSQKWFSRCVTVRNVAFFFKIEEMLVWNHSQTFLDAVS